MKNIKTIIIVIILILTGVLAVVGLNAAKNYLSGAAGGSEPSNVRVQADLKSASISWQTDKESQAIVEYGTTPASLLLRALENQAVVNHKVNLSPLKSGATYYFRIRVGETIYDNNGIPFSFKTKSAEEIEPTPEATVTPPAVEDQLSPTRAATGSASLEKVTTCVRSEFALKFGTEDSAYDLDSNGIVNTGDWIKCLRDNS